MRYIKPEVAFMRMSVRETLAAQVQTCISIPGVAIPVIIIPDDDPVIDGCTGPVEAHDMAS